MQINEFENVISACRYCFMCRHLAPVSLVSCRECDTPRGRALIADTVRMHPEALATPDFIDAIYNSDLSGANRRHCDGYHSGKGYDEIGLQLALRRDIVAAGLEPEAVKQTAAELRASAAWRIDGKADVLYFIDPATAKTGKTADAFLKLLAKANIDCATITGGCIGKALAVLGYADDAKNAMAKFADAANRSGAKTLVVSSPAAYDALINDYPANRVGLALEVRFAAEFITDLAKAGKLAFRGNTGTVSYLPGDYLTNYAKRDFAEQLLAVLKAENRMFGTNTEESHTAGEGALVLDKLNPALTQRMAERVAAATEPGVRLVVSSAHTADLLAAAGVVAVTLEELALEAVC